MIFDPAKKIGMHIMQVKYRFGRFSNITCEEEKADDIVAGEMKWHNKIYMTTQYF